MGQSLCREAVGSLTSVRSATATRTGATAHAFAALHAGNVRPRRRRTRGVTLIELLVAISILAIVAAIATPNFSTFLHNSRISSESAKLFADIEMARSEASRRNATVTICPIASGNACSQDWTQPRVIFIDANNDGTYGAGEELIRNGDAPTGRVVIAAANLGTGANLVRFRSSGISNAPTANWSFCESNSTLSGQTLSLNGSGRPTTQQSSCP